MRAVRGVISRGLTDRIALIYSKGKRLRLSDGKGGGEILTTDEQIAAFPDGVTVVLLK